MMRGNTVDSLARGDTGRVREIRGLDPAESARLLEMGFDEGAEVELLHRAPLGDPLAVRVDGAMVGLRRALARAIILD
ncbi:FeoA family protein [Sandaracinobacteroides sp. A072]|uniref:FeoA family protein n=1 Tax=Sandaracinobacteroides sp. A072 TaxID=3461146 RepID=UPI004041CC51